MVRFHPTVLAWLVVIGLAAPAAAQVATVTEADIQRLQDNVTAAERDLAQLRSRDATRAGRLQPELDELREDVIYLRVKLRRERSVPRAEYAEVRDRIEALRTLAGASGPAAAPTATASPPAGPQGASRPAATAGAPAATALPPGMAEIPVGTELDVRLQHSLNSGTAQVEDRFEGTTVADLQLNGRTLIPAGSVLRGVVTSVEPGTRTNRTARMAVSFDQVTIGTRSYPMRGTVTQAIQGDGLRGEAGRIGAGAGIGAIIGGVLGGVRGALAGIAIGGGGMIAATEGNEVELPQGTVLRVRLDSALQVADR
jgi:hypothetical protein